MKVKVKTREELNNNPSLKYGPHGFKGYTGPMGTYMNTDMIELCGDIIEVEELDDDDDSRCEFGYLYRSDNWDYADWMVDEVVDE